MSELVLVFSRVMFFLRLLGQDRKKFLIVLLVWLELILENGGLLIVHMEKGEHMMLLLVI